MPDTLDHEPIAPTPTDEEREEQEKQPPRKPVDEPVIEKEEPNPDAFPSSELADKLGPYTKTTG